ncbi:hypothetical protein [Brevundimonas sp. G8]|uniref:hypothetical protein n=1 Tax=Brevundimonas sp. G8 TaxID=1350776 RepID=UPI00135C0579|nr:hypothetical protein [Brevundimonas sp. G8]
MKVLLEIALTFVFVLALLLGTKAMQIGGPDIVRVLVCGAVGSGFASLVCWSVGRHLRQRPVKS